MNDIYKINLAKSKEERLLNNIAFKIINFKSREEKLTLNLKVLFNDIENNTKNLNLNYIYNNIYITLIKLTNNSTFILIKCIFDPNNVEIDGIAINKTLKKIFNKINKISNMSKTNISF